MIRQVFSNYVILKKLGEGGMGEVYLAEDTSLNRKVALKFLAEHLQENPTAKKRFLREAQATAALDHPYICKIYESAEIDNKAFIAMEYVRGTTLRDRLHQGALEPREALKLVLEISEALQAAHKQNIIHRDLKPSNVILTPDGHAKLMDFGLAKRLVAIDEIDSDDQTVTASLTQSGARVGTLAYMSPEQLRGKEIDARSDIFSFGIILYELLTGAHPFKKETPIDTATAILSEDPPPLSRYSHHVPEILQHVVTKMLAKQPDARYQLVHEVKTDLRHAFDRLVDEAGTHAFHSAPQNLVAVSVSEGGGRNHVGRINFRVLWAGLLIAFLATGTGLVFWRPAWLFDRPDSGARRSGIAVLPFAEIDSEGDSPYLGDGLTEELINALTQLNDVKVVNRASVFEFKERTGDLREIVEKLNVRYLLTGTVRRTGNRVRVSAQLVNGEDGYQLWARTYEGSLQDVFELQENIAQQIVRALEVEIRSMLSLSRKRYKPNAEAYDLYLKGRYHWNLRTREGLWQAVHYFTRAVDRDERFAMAYAGLADSYALLGSVEYGDVPRAEAMLRAREAAAAALAQDDELAQAHTSHAFLKFWYDWDWQGAEASFKRAIQLNPGYTTAHHWYADLLMVTGRAAEAIQEVKLARELDPLSLIVNTALGTHLYFAREYEHAVRQLLSTLELDPAFAPARLSLGAVYLQQKRFEQAIAEFEAAREISSGSWVTAELGYAYGAAGREKLAEQILNSLLDRRSHEYVSPLYIAVVLVGLGRKDEAFEWLQRAYEERAQFLDWLAVDPRFDSIRSDARFAKLQRAVGITPSSLHEAGQMHRPEWADVLTPPALDHAPWCPSFFNASRSKVLSSSPCTASTSSIVVLASWAKNSFTGIVMTTLEEGTGGPSWLASRTMRISQCSFLWDGLGSSDLKLNL